MSEAPEPGWRESAKDDAGTWILKITLLLVPLIYLSGYYRGTHYPKLLALQISVCALAVCCITARSLWLSRRSSFVLPVVLLLLITALQTLRSINPSEALLSLTTQVSFGLLALFAAFLVPPGREVALVRFSAAAGLIVGILGILEHLGLWLPPSSGRPGATFGFRNIAAMYLAANLPLSILLLLRRTTRDFILGAFATVSMGAFLVMTRTRGAWLGIGLASSMALIVMFQTRGEGGVSLAREVWKQSSSLRRWVMPILLLASLAIGSLSPRHEDASLHRLDEKKTGVTSTLLSTLRSGGDRGRFRIWNHTIEMILDSPLIGVGMGNWSILYPFFDAGDGLVLESAPKRPHNDLLWIWAELGPSGLLIYLWFIVLVFCSLLKRSSTGCSEDRNTMIWMAAGVMALFIQSLFSFPREQVAGSMVFWLAAGLIARGETGRASGRVGNAIRWGAAASLVAGLGGVWLLTRAIAFDEHFHESLVAHETGRPDVQLAEAKLSRETGIFDHRVFLQEANALHDLGRFSDAIQTYREYLIYQPYLPAIYNNLGRSLLANGDSSGAEAAYKKGLEIFPAEPTLSNNLAVLFKEKGDVASALEIYEGGKNAEGYHNLGLIRAQEGALGEAEAAYKEAINRDPSMVEVYYSLGGLYLLMDEFDKSAETFEAFLKSGSDNATLVRRTKARLLQLYPVLGDRHMRGGNFEAAGRVYSRIVGLGGGTAGVYGNLANIYGRRGEKARALSACRKAIELDPDFAKAHFTLASLLDEAGSAQEARKSYLDFLDRWQKDDRFAKRARGRISALKASP